MVQFVRMLIRSERVKDPFSFLAFDAEFQVPQLAGSGHHAIMFRAHLFLEILMRIVLYGHAKKANHSWMICIVEIPHIFILFVKQTNPNIGLL